QARYIPLGGRNRRSGGWLDGTQLDRDFLARQVVHRYNNMTNHVLRNEELRNRLGAEHTHEGLTHIRIAVVERRQRFRVRRYRDRVADGGLGGSLRRRCRRRRPGFDLRWWRHGPVVLVIVNSTQHTHHDHGGRSPDHLFPERLVSVRFRIPHRTTPADCLSPQLLYYRHRQGGESRRRLDAVES